MSKPAKSRLYVIACTTSFALTCVLSVSSASAQGSGPPLPPLPPDLPGSEPIAPPSSEAPPTTAPAPVPPESTPSVPAPSKSTASVRITPLRVVGSRVRRSGRTLHVNVTCGRSGTVTVSRKGRLVGRRAFVCPASGSLAVRVRATIGAGLRAGALVRDTVRAGDHRHAKSMRVVRAGRASGAGQTLARASSGEDCSAWYWTSKLGFYWQTSSEWAEFYCKESGIVGYHIVHRWPLYFWNANNETWEFYGEWRQWTQDGSLRYWSVADGAWSGPY